MATNVEIHNLFMAHEKFLQGIVKHLSAEPGIEALFLAGSYGQAKADRFSDIDLVAIAEEQHHERISELWRATLEGLHTVVFWNERRGRRILLNAIMDDWLRCDLYISISADFVGRWEHVKLWEIDQNH